MPKSNHRLFYPSFLSFEPEYAMQHEPQIVKLQDFSHRAVEATLKIGLSFVLLNRCFQNAKPLINALT